MAFSTRNERSMQAVSPNVPDDSTDARATLLQSVDTDSPPEMRGSSGSRLGMAALPAAVLVGLAVAAASRWGGLSFRAAIDDVEIFALVEADTVITVKDSCPVYEAGEGWEPVTEVHKAWQVQASGPKRKKDKVDVLPIKAIVDPEKKETLQAGVVEVRCLEVTEEDTTVQEINDCVTDFDHWQTKWIPARQNWCCANHNKACVTHPVPKSPLSPDLTTTVMPSSGNQGSGQRASFPSTFPAGVCTEAHVASGYKICQKTYCGTDTAVSEPAQASRPVNVESAEACAKLCDEDHNCVAYEIYGLDGKQCTQRPYCGHPLFSTIGTSVAFKLSTAQPGPSPGSSPDSWPVTPLPVGSLPANLPEKCSDKANFSQGEFNCKAGWESWVMGWSVRKQQWCCLNCGLACEIPTASSTTTMRTYYVTPAATTHVLTTSTLTSTTTTGSAAFDCDAGSENAYKGWSVWKKRWCCTNEHQGCGVRGAISGHFRLNNLDYVKLTKDPVLEKLVFQAVKEGLINVCGSAGEAVSLDLRDIVLEYWQVDGPNIAVHFAVKKHGGDELKLRNCLQCAEMDEKVLKAVGNVAKIETITDDTLDFSHCRVQQNVLKVPCVCHDGNVVSEDKCDGDGELACESCFLGFTLTRARTCDPNQCNCQNGIGAKGAGCDVDGAQSCGFCKTGFHMEKPQSGKNWICVQNMCTCNHGSPAKGSACHMHQSTTCAICDDGYHLFKADQTYTCEENTCFCDNGEPAEGTDCATHETEACRSCHAGFHLDPVKKTCVQNVCTCENGNAAAGVACLTHDQEICVSCENGAFLGPHGRCGNKMCECPNGVAVKGELCTTNHGKICSTCNTGFRLYLKQCVPSMCHCEGGAPSANCTQDSPCATCQPSFHMEHGQCRRNMCTCAHGVAATGPLCLQNRLEVCATCKEGYHAVTGSDPLTNRITMNCVENKCHCDFGTKADTMTSPTCHTHQAQICSRCEDGYEMGSDHICRMKHCQCEHGYGTRFNECTVQGSQNCKECLEGYHLTTQGVMLRNTQRCASNSLTKAQFDCDAGYTKRLLGWSQLKKDWCCRNKDIACIVSGEPGTEACNSKFNEGECKLIGCCVYDSNRGCRSAVGDKACVTRRTLKLSGSPDFCLFPNRDKTVGVVTCNEQTLQGTNRQYWTYDQSTKQIHSTGYAGQCLQTAAALGEGASVNEEWHDVHLVDCSEPATQAWTLNPSRTRFTAHMHTKGAAEPLCLGVREGWVESIGALAVVRKCDAKEKVGQDWDVPDVLVI